MADAVAADQDGAADAPQITAPRYVLRRPQDGRGGARGGQDPPIHGRQGRLMVAHRDGVQLVDGADHNGVGGSGGVKTTGTDEAVKPAVVTDADGVAGAGADEVRVSAAGAGAQTRRHRERTLGARGEDRRHAHEAGEAMDVLAAPAWGEPPVRIHRYRPSRCCVFRRCVFRCDVFRCCVFRRCVSRCCAFRCRIFRCGVCCVFRCGCCCGVCCVFRCGACCVFRCGRVCGVRLVCLAHK